MSLEAGTEQYKLLIVDDSKISRMRIHAYFTANCPDWEVREAATGDEALTAASSFRPHYVTMDVNMPGISGFEAAERLLEADPSVRIVMFTANVQESSRRMAASMQVGFVAKPPTETSLHQAHQYLLGA